MTEAKETIARQEFKAAAREFSLLRKPTLQDYQDHFALVRRLHVPNFSTSFQRAKAFNTPSYQEAVAVTRKRIRQAELRNPIKNG